VELASAPRVVRIAEIIAEAEDRMRTALSRRTLLEVTLIRCARAAKAVSLDEVLQRVNALRGGGYEAPPARADSVAEAELKLTDEPNPDLRPGADAGREERSGEDLRRLEAGWRKVVEKVGSLAVGLKGLLVDAVPAAVSGDTVTIAFDPEFESEIGQFDVHRNRHAMEIAVASVLGRKLKLAFVAREKAAGVAPAESEEPPAPSAGKEPEKRGRAKSIGDWAGDPAVRKVMDMFDGTIAEVRNLK
jgi:DNA polymerase III gamma/tau subunit